MMDLFEKILLLLQCRAKAGLSLLLFGNVFQQTGNAVDFPLGVFHREHVGIDPADFAVRPNDPVLLPDRDALKVDPPVRLKSFVVFRMDQIEPGFGSGGETVRSRAH